MPITYSSQLNANTIQDADSSIVLSDLLRSGETSRLRRRGAVRLDHVHRNEDSQDGTYFRLYCKECEPPLHRPFSSPPPTPYVPSIFPSSKSAKGKERAVEPQHPDRTLVHSRVMAQRLPHIDASLHVHPPSTSTYPPTSTQVHAFLSRTHRIGNLTQLEGVSDADTRDPDTENGILVWTSVSDPADGALALMHYEDGSDQSAEQTAGNDSRLMTIGDLATRRPGPISTACMCKRDVIGCTVCGSPLGMRYTPCSTAVKKIFPSSTSASRPSVERTFITANSRSLPSPPRLNPNSNPTPANSNADVSNYRRRVADYLLTMRTPRSHSASADTATPTTIAQTLPVVPSPVRVTPESNNSHAHGHGQELENGRAFEVSILPRRVSVSQDSRSQRSLLLPRNQETIIDGQYATGPFVTSSSGSASASALSRSNSGIIQFLHRLHHQDSSENEEEEEGEEERSPLSQIHPVRQPRRRLMRFPGRFQNRSSSQPQQSDTETLTETETETDDPSDDDGNEERFLNAVGTQLREPWSRSGRPMVDDDGGGSGDTLEYHSGHWELGNPTRYVYRFFAEAVVAEHDLEKESERSSSSTPLNSSSSSSNSTLREAESILGSEVSTGAEAGAGVGVRTEAEADARTRVDANDGADRGVANRETEGAEEGTFIFGSRMAEAPS